MTQQKVVDIFELGIRNAVQILNSILIAVLIDEEIKTILDDSYKRAHTLLKTHRKELDALAEALINYETLDAEEVKAVLEGRPLKMKKKPKDG